VPRLAIGLAEIAARHHDASAARGQCFRCGQADAR
jgi:hypothetical protein